MPFASKLHPAVRERTEARMSLTALAEYMILLPDGQETVLHDNRFARTAIVTANGDAMRALRAYNADSRRPVSSLESVKDALTRKAATAEKPYTRDEALRCKEAIQLFQDRENALGMRGLALRAAPRFEPLDIEGVTVSAQPDLMVDGPNETIGAAIIRVAKAPDPAACKLETTRLKRGDHRREMARYMVAILQLLLADQEIEPGLVDPSLCFVADIRLGERIGPAPDHTARIDAIRANCRQIKRNWGLIQPRNSVLAK